MTPVDMIHRLITFDTTSHRSNLEMIGWIADYLDSHGIASSLIHDAERRKANLFATLGPGETGGIVLSGHTDVVPVDGQPWDTDPFEVSERDGRLYGRGTSDMKSFIAVVLALVPEFLESGLARPVHLAFSYDEEVGCLGVHGLVAELKRRDIRPEAVIVGEPTCMEVVDAHKGIAVFQTAFRGVPAHSSATHIGVSATHAAGRFVAFLDDMFEEYQSRARPDLGFVPPYTTIQVGILNGGTASNIIAQDCLVDWHFRAMSTDDPEEIESRARSFLDRLRTDMKARHTGCDIVTTAGSQVPPLKPDSASPATQLALQLTGANSTSQASFGTEAGIFQESRFPAVVCGPGDIAQAHQPNEYITIEQVDACADFLRRLMARVSKD